MELTRTFPDEVFGKALDAWSWLDLEGLEPWFATAFGDIFFVGDDGIYWLDLTSGEITSPFRDAEEAKAVLATVEGMDEFLLAGLAFAAAEAGLEPRGEDVLAYRLPPVLDGEFEVENLEIVAFVDAVRKAGVLHEQIKDLPDGAEIPGYD